MSNGDSVIFNSRDFGRLIHSTAIPTNQEAHQIRDALSNDEKNVVRLERRIKQLTDEVKRIQSTIAPLTVELGKLYSMIYSRKAMVATIRRIPPEILGQIFIYCLPDNQFVQPFKANAPLLLCQICSAWRMSALAIPQLWSSLNIFRMKSMGWDPARTWFGRSGKLPLSIGVREEIFRTKTFADPLTKKFLARCRNLSIGITSAFVDGLCMDNLQGPNWGSLDSVEIYSFYGFSLGTPITLPASATNVRQIKLKSPNYSDHLDRLELGLAWNRLTHFSSAPFLSANRVLQLFRCCPELTHCSIKCSGRPHGVSPVTHMMLQSFHFTYDGSNQHYLGDFFDSFSLPALQDMQMDLRGADLESGIWPTTQIVSFLSRSACPLQKLEIKGLKMAEEDILSCVQHVPSLMEATNSTPVYSSGDFREDDITPESVLRLLAGRRLQFK
ncbi:hypothetical protein PILCRDRAFT_132466 [Piloderma croceum F 1598]|uniref:Uncharacterized protein n=1 Tax=Piloderma croceum (strain F 1598) TaxID=765440 RepID=A0A0C3BYC6_PILCF|nr:hypothetical protein PILCRDRAFT_132466 [Piloderma croceum F 1598]